MSMSNIKLMEINDTQSWIEVNKNKITYKISAEYVKACRRKVRKTVIDERADISV